MVLHLALAATVVYVPMVRDALNIAVLAGHTRYVDRAYNKTVVGEEIQMVDAGAKFRYPDGYFATDFATGATIAPTPDPFAPKIISTYTPPKPEPSPSPSPSPVAPPPAPGNSTVASAGGTAAVSPEQSAKTEPEGAKDADEEVLGINETEFNKRPLKDWLARANVLKEKGVINLDGVVEMTVEANLTADCKLDEAKVTQNSGDTHMVGLAKELAAAIGDSRMLLFLAIRKSCQGTKITALRSHGPAF